MYHFMRIFVATLCLIMSLPACKTSVEVMATKKENNLAVTHTKFRGTIFRENYPFSKLFVSDVDSTTRFTPTKYDIVKAERLLRQQLSSINKSRINQLKSNPIIHKNLNNYFRQYVGVMNHRGERIIHINFYWDKYSLFERIKGYSDSRLKFEDDYAIVFDGGSRYWQVNVNLTTEKLSDLQVNGIASKKRHITQPLHQPGCIAVAKAVSF